MKILVVHQYYLMPGSPGGSRFNEFARLWREAGHEVTVIAGNLDYATGQVPARYQGRFITREDDQGTTVYRCAVPQSYAKGFVGRAAAFAGFTFSALVAALRVARPDVVVATSPPLVAAIPGFVAARARWRRVPWVFEIRDLWPESAVTTGVLSATSPLTRALYGLERWAVRGASKVNVLTPAFREDLVRRGLCGDDHVVFVPNGADVEQFVPGPRDNAVRRELGWGDKTVVMYAGAHGRANALGQMIDAAERLKHRPDLLLCTIGDGPERAALEAETARRGLDNLKFYGAQPKARVADFINACDIGAAVLQNNPTFRTVYPNKVFDYMACMRPTLLAIDGVARDLVVTQAQAGRFVEPENGAAFAAEAVALADDPEARQTLGENGRRWVLEHATRASLAARYLRVFEELVAR
ncbi:MAG: glycosyltransferase family 4 protein [Myxococcales bacterium]|nr:glycosyltransferase family 4 protein [Myxococcales bacterium]